MSAELDIVPRLSNHDVDIYERLFAVLQQLLDAMECDVEAVRQENSHCAEAIADCVRRFISTLECAGAGKALDSLEITVVPSEMIAQRLLSLADAATGEWVGYTIGPITCPDQDQWRRVRHYVARFGDAVLQAVRPKCVPAPGAGDGGNSIRMVGKIWYLRYGNESGDYPAIGNRCVGLLAKLLAKPNRLLTVADLRGDPEGKLAADAMFGGDRETNLDGHNAIRKRLQNIDKELQDIDTIAADAGWAESMEEKKVKLENEQKELLRRLKPAVKNNQVRSPMHRAHHNFAAQLRSFVKKQADTMPQLAAHLKAAIKIAFPTFGYFPPSATHAWQT